MTAREVDQNGFILIEKNPISRVGVFPYSGRNLPGADPEKIYNVLRPEEELSNPETLASFQLLPIIDDHTMLGEGFTPAESVGTHGTTGEGVTFSDGIIYAPLRIFSDTLKKLIDQGKKQLSCGYRCVWEKASGFFNGQPYDYIQRNIRGNHIALVQEGRMGADIAVLDHAFDSFDLNSNQETHMADEPETKEEEKKEMTLAELTALMADVMPQIAKLNEAVSKLTAPPAADEPKVDEDPALDEDAEEKKEKEAMDSRISALEARGTKEILAEVKKRDRLASEVQAHIGTFDHADMTADEVAAYAIGKFGLKAPKGQEQAILSGYLAGRSAEKSPVGLSFDAKPKDGGKLAARLNS
jgi:hypothetical protein